VNSGFYCDVLRRLNGNMGRRRPERLREQTWLFHHDNAPCHTSVLTQQFMTKQKIAVIPHPPYSPDLVPCDFLFPNMKFNLIGLRFITIEEIPAESSRLLDTLTEKGFQDAFQKWRSRWDWCLHAGGSYFEGDGGR
jgi:histone-lysine N-methyltransferase SETMAR